MITLADILQALTGQRPSTASLPVCEAEIDSRQVIPGAMFVALYGERTDGHDYVAEAFERGASLALVQRHPGGNFPILDLRQHTLPQEYTLPDIPFCIMVNDTLQALQTIAHFWRRQLNTEVIGITGSVGKSTTKELIAEVISQRYRTMKSPGNRNNEIGLPLTMLSIGRGHQRAVLEMGFYVPGEIAFLCEIALPKIGVITNISPVHAERAGSIEAIAQGKSELVQALPKDGVAILNYDDPLVKAMAEKTQARVFFYGLDPSSDLWADQIESKGLKGITLKLHHGGEDFILRAPLIGHHSVHTILRAAAVGLIEGLSWQEIARGIQQGRNQLRMVAIQTARGALIIDDSYNASPDSTIAALNLLADMKGRKIAVLGDMLELGPYEKEGHEKVGLRAAEVCDALIAIGERSKITAQAARQGGLSPTAITWMESVAQAIEFLKPRLQKGDTVLVKGSLGMKMSPIVAALEEA